VEFVATPRSVVISPRADGVEVELSITPLAEGLLKVIGRSTVFLCSADPTTPSHWKYRLWGHKFLSAHSHTQTHTHTQIIGIELSIHNAVHRLYSDSSGCIPFKSELSPPWQYLYRNQVDGPRKDEKAKG
jgi:hypothetical protein